MKNALWGVYKGGHLTQVVLRTGSTVIAVSLYSYMTFVHVADVLLSVVQVSIWYCV